MATTKTTCPQQDALQAFVGGSLPPDQEQLVENHLLGCAACVETLVQMDVANTTIAETLRELAARGAHPERAFIEDLVEKLKHSLAKARSNIAHADHPTVDEMSKPSEATSSEAKSPDAAASPAATFDFLAPPQQPDEIGRLGGHRVIKELGQGGMGVVFQADDIALNRMVALKAMLPAMASNPTAKLRFIREAQLTAKLNHDNIVSIFQVGEDRGVPFLVMPLLSGQPLDKLLKRGRMLRTSHILRIGREVAQGLAAAHAAGLIHRDIKPSNLWIEPVNGGRVKILDFGLARASAIDKTTGEEARLTVSNAIVGTPAYMAPEQAQSESKLDQRCDLFSLGCVLYELCTGEVPFKGNDITGILLSLVLNDPVPPRQIRPELPQALSDLILKMLSKDPNARPQSATEVAQALRSLEKQLGSPGVDASAVDGESSPGILSDDAVEPAESLFASADIEGAAESRADNPGESRATDVRPPSPKTCPALPVSLPRRPGRHSFRRQLVVAAMVLLMLVPLGYFFGGTVVRFAFNEGQLVIEADGQVQVTVLAGGKQIEVFDTRTKQTHSISAGKKYALRIKQLPDGIDVETDEFLLQRGGRKVVDVRMEMARAANNNKDNKDRKTLQHATKDPANTVAPLTTDPLGMGEWQTLFNGKDLTGFRFWWGGNKDWFVQDGLLRGSRDAALGIGTKPLDRYVLEFDVRQIDPKKPGRFSVLLHADLNAKHLLDHHVQVEGLGQRDVGTIMTNLKGRTRSIKATGNFADAIRPGWNTFTVQVNDTEVAVAVNGVELTRGHSALSQGLVGLHVTTAPMEFRNIRIKRAQPSQPASATELGWTPLFNGRNLGGWKTWSGPGKWAVRDGVLIGDGNTTLGTIKTYGDYMLRFDVLHSKKLSENFLLYLHAQLTARDLPVNYINLVGFDNPFRGDIISIIGKKNQHFNGSRALLDQVLKSGWNTFTTIAKNEDITLFVNDAKICDAKSTGRREGYIAFSTVSDPVQIRDIRIKPLSETEPVPIVDKSEWVSLFNGKDATGWKLGVVKDGVLQVLGKNGATESTVKHSRYSKIHFEFRVAPATDAQVLVYRHIVLPLADYARLKYRQHQAMAAHASPLGEWNVVELDCDAKKIAVWLNGKLVDTKDQYDRDYEHGLAFQVAVGKLDLRDIRIRDFGANQLKAWLDRLERGGPMSLKLRLIVPIGRSELHATFSSDSNYIALGNAAAASPRSCLLDTETGKRLSPTNDFVFGVVYSAEQQQYAYYVVERRTRATSLRVLALAGRKERFSIPVKSPAQYTAAFVPGHPYLVYAEEDTVHFRHLDNSETKSLPVQSRVQKLALAGDGKYLAVHSGKKISVWDWKQGKQLWSAPADAWFPANDRLIVPAEGGSYHLLDFATGKLLSAFNLTRIEDVSRDGQKILEGGYTAKIYSIQGKLQLGLKPGSIPRGGPSDIFHSFSPDGKWVMALRTPKYSKSAPSNCRYVLVWSTATGDLVQTIEIPLDLGPNMNYAMSPDGKLLAITTSTRFEAVADEREGALYLFEVAKHDATR